MPSFARALFQALILVLAASAAAMAVNYVRPDGLPWKGDWSAQAQREISLRGFEKITRAELDAVEREGHVVLLDPRELRLSRWNLPTTSLNLPPRDVPSRIEEIKVLSEAGMVIVVLCESERCALGAELAAILKKNGFSRFRVFRGEGGTGVPREAFLPGRRKGT